MKLPHLVNTPITAFAALTAFAVVVIPALAFGQGSPVPPSRIGLETRPGGIALHWTNGPCATSQLLVSSDLLHWTAIPFPTDNPAPDRFRAFVPTATSVQFFRLAQARSPDCDPAPDAGLFAHWKLDGDWLDAQGRHPLTPERPGGFAAAAALRPGPNLAYGPTGAATSNGARTEGLTSLPEAEGLTLEGWVSLPDDNSRGVLFGFGDDSWEAAKLHVASVWGFLQVRIGSQADGATAQYARIGDTCWHHVALVLPRGFRAGEPFRFYLDGVKLAPSVIEHSPTGTNVLSESATLWGSAFAIGRFGSAEPGPSGGRQKVDEVRLWARELDAAEIAHLAIPTGEGPKCDEFRPPAWAPGLRFQPPATPPVPAPTLGIHVLTDDTLAIITDPNPWLKQRFLADCGEFFRALEQHRPALESWVAPLHYDLGAQEVVHHYRPALLAALGRDGHFRIAGPGQAEAPLADVTLWPQASREFRAPRLTPGTGEEHVSAVEMVYYTYCRLPFRLQPGATYRVVDAWGNAVEWTYREDRTVSWALKVNQLGYLADAPNKYAYLGAWLGPQRGALDLARFDGAPFHLCRESDDQVAWTGRIRFRADENQRIHPANAEPVILSGERVYELDFSPFSTPGRYYVRVPGAGRSWPFVLGQNALGEAFFVHARGLFHQRCGHPLLSDHTAWPRGDRHTNTFRAAFPTEAGAYADHLADGYGFRDADGLFPQVPPYADLTFAAVAATMTPERLPHVVGGWHDAADYDRPGWRHLIAVADLTESYLLFPDNFTDGQLNLPESGNGLPDLLDEAVWGMEVWRQAQEPDGRVALHIEADSHPHESDPGRDTQPYALGLATRNSSLQYAEHAARLARALALAGSPERSMVFLDSARRAFAFGMRPGPRISISLTLWDQSVTWSEPEHPDPKAVVRALVQLWLASDDAAFRTALDAPELDRAFRQDVDDLYWRTSGFDHIDVALAPDRFPSGWAAYARRGIVATADGWLEAQASHAYRKVWYAPDHGYFGLMQWGASGFRHLRELVAAWRLTGDAKYRTGALLGIDWMHGANPQGRVNTTGLGANSIVHPLHLPSDADGIAEPVPGLSIYGYSYPIPHAGRSHAYGLFSAPRINEGFSLRNLAQLPPPWNDPDLDLEAIAEVLSNGIPLWRRLVTLENNNVPQTEFDINGTIGHAAAVTGCLLGPGWTPGPELRHRQPRSAAQLQDSLWYQP